MRERLVLLLCLVSGIQGDVIVMKDVTLGFGQALEQCRGESKLTVDQMEEFYHFWGPDFKFEDRELGCAILCMSRHFNLLTDGSRMHHDNTAKFIRSFPNGEILAQKMVAIIHACELQHDAKEDHCWRVLHVAECFKMECQTQDLAPKMELMMAEFIIEAESV